MENVEHKYIEFINQFCIDTIDHSNRHLNDHLIGTYRILEEWGCSKEVRLAGLFHSVYGTQYFKQSALSLTERTLIKNLISNEAETLVYLFCRCDRERFFIYNKKQSKYVLKTCLESQFVVVDNQTFTRLIEISFANLLEQIDHIEGYLNKGVLEQIYIKWVNLLCFIPNKAKQDFKSYFENKL